MHTRVNNADDNDNEWEEIMAESDSGEEWDEDTEENAWEDLLVRMQSNASENKTHLRAPYTGSSERTSNPRVGSRPWVTYDPGRIRVRSRPGGHF